MSIEHLLYTVNTIKTKSEMVTKTQILLLRKS